MKTLRSKTFLSMFIITTLLLSSQKVYASQWTDGNDELQPPNSRIQVSPIPEKVNRKQKIDRSHSKPVEIGGGSTSWYESLLSFFTFNFSFSVGSELHEKIELEEEIIYGKNATDHPTNRHQTLSDDLGIGNK